MGKETDCDDVDKAALRHDLAEATKKLTDAETLVTKLTTDKTDAEKKAKDATDELDKYKAAEKTALIDSITKRSDFKTDDLKAKTIEDLRTMRQAIDHVKIEGTVKSVRKAGDVERVNITADGKIDPSKSLMGNPVRQADGSFKWVVPGAD